MNTADPQIRSTHIDPRRPPEAELGTTLAGAFSLAVVGDLIPSRPIAALRPDIPGFDRVAGILRSVDLCCGNLETSVIDIARFAGHPYCWDGDWPLLAEPGVVEDLKSLGFRLLGRANNHALDWGIEGMRETSDRLDAAGIVHAGAGGNLGLARRPAYLDTPQGRIGLVSAATTFRPTTEAMPPQAFVPGRPGISGLHLRQIDRLPEVEIALLRSLDGARQVGDEVHVFGRRFETAVKRGYRHEMDGQDLASILASIRLGKQHSDMLITMLHAHETGNDAYLEPPSPVLRDFAEAAIEAGADVVAVSGIHHLGPADIHRGRPIFYGLGNFIWSDMQEALPAELVGLNAQLMADACEKPERATAADFNAVVNATCFAHPEVFETILPIVRFDRDRLVEIVIHPVELGYGEPLTRSGIPRLATGEQARRILERFAAVSVAYGAGCRIEISGETAQMLPRDALP